MKEYTQQEINDLIAKAKDKARKAGVSEEALGFIDSHADPEKPYQIGNIEDFLKLKDEDISEASFVLWFTLDNE